MEGRILDHPILNFTRKKRVKIFFEGNEIEAYEGETVAVALHAAGIKVLRYTPINGRSAGLFCAVGKCSSCLMEIDGMPNVRSCMTKVKAGMQIRRQHEKGDLV
ncbi:MAG: (2Fe-2S)-binding protein [Thermotogae bacterium]|jgi:sarcosine oxidase subunit alpha|nr:(2Fe-2S)-binding protein [Thermotogota bacterium]MCL5031894.1 (2Fe-2S)-binding protein [Thermotogota bacterium]